MWLKSKEKKNAMKNILKKNKENKECQKFVLKRVNE